MSRRIVSGIILFVLLVGMSTFVVQLVKSAPMTITVPDDYLTIQEAINAASDGDTVFVRNGTYYEHIVVNKTLSLIGEGADKTTINGDRKGKTVVVNANNVSIRNFRIEEGGHSIIENDCALFINGSGTKILSNDIFNSVILIASPWYGEPAPSGNTITNNNLAFGARAILLEWGAGNTIADNFIFPINGVSVAVGSNNTIVGNYIGNDAGWPLIIDTRNNVSGNTIVLNTPYWEEFSCLHIRGDDNNITNNNIIGNATGITVESSNNIIYHNNFVNNVQANISCNNCANTWDNGYPSGGNYWDDYQGTDFFKGPNQNITGTDGIGDTPYVKDENNTDRYPLIRPWKWPIVADINYDFKVEMRDIGTACRAFGTVPGDARWNYHADITGPIPLEPDNKVDMRDIGLIASNFGEKYP